MFGNTDHQSLYQTLEAFAVPMFAAERPCPTDPFRMICINSAYTDQSGLTNDIVRAQRTSDFLHPEDAAAVEQRYCECVHNRTATNYAATLVFNDIRTQWNTTLQPVFLPDGTERIIGTAFAIDRLCETLGMDDAAYFAASAQMQMGKLRHFIDMLEQRADLPADMRDAAFVVGNLTRSIDAILGDLRARTKPHQNAFGLEGFAEAVSA
ncbi:hypothetical protein [Yoonia sp. SS1-5]|uniref:PAS domain-containing protein n=1 Tax=Yoonia rhodophyticola TaxID=3137370 RepID=A0AAN0MDB0_9RHOB